MAYLSDMSKALAKIPDKSNSRPMHGPAVRFLTELLKQVVVSWTYCKNNHLLFLFELLIYITVNIRYNEHVQILKT